MNNLTVKTDGALITADHAAKLMSGIAESRATAPLMSGGKPLLRMLKSGEWVIGQTNDEVQEGSRWAINIMTLTHGWCCWSNNENPKEKNSLLGESMTSVTEPRPPLPADINGTPYKDQRAFDLRCLDGEDEGLEVAHKVTSIGGLRAVDGLLGAIFSRLRTDPAHPCPVVQLSHDWYDHPKWGRIYTPIYGVVDWCDLAGNLASAPKVEAPQRTLDPEPTLDVPPKRGRPPVTPRPEPEVAARRPDPAPAPVATAQLHTGQRRRPVAR